MEEQTDVPVVVVFEKHTLNWSEHQHRILTLYYHIILLYLLVSLQGGLRDRFE